jgi:carbamoyl-phosphate synthase large subunit
VTGEIMPPYYSVKEAVFPFVKFPGVDTILGPEMKSTGEVMGVGRSFAEAFVKSQLGAGREAADVGQGVHQSVKNERQAPAWSVGWRGAARSASRWSPPRARPRPSRRAGDPGDRGQQGQEGRPHIVDMLKNGEISLVINTVEEKRGAIPIRVRSAPRRWRSG